MIAISNTFVLWNIGVLKQLVSASLSCDVTSMLRTQEEGSTNQTYCMLLDCLCSWGHIGHVLELLLDWLPQGQPPNKVGRVPQVLERGSVLTGPSYQLVSIALSEQLSS